MIAGIDPDGAPRVFETDPSGTPYEWTATAVGGDHAALLGYLEDNYREDLDLDGGVALALAALAETHDEDDFDADSLEVTTVDVESHAVRSLDAEEIAPHLAELHPEDDDE